MEINYNGISDLLEQNKKYITSKSKVIENIPDTTLKSITKIRTTTDDTANNLGLEKKKSDFKKEVFLETPEMSSRNETIEKKEASLKKEDFFIDDISFTNIDNANINLDSADRINNPLSTDIDFINGIASNTASAVQGIINYGSQFQNGFNNETITTSQRDNSTLIEKKSDIKKTVDLTAINSIPYSVDSTIKSFQSGTAANSIISGVLGVIDSVGGLSDSMYDLDEMIQLASANFNSMTTNGKLFNNDVLGFNLNTGGNKPGIKIKTKTEEGYKTFEGNTPEYSGYARGNLGFLYVRPFQNDIQISPFKIPFQMNAKISEDTIQANYASEQFLNRVGELKSFIGTGGLNLTLETTYFVLADDIPKWNPTEQIYNDAETYENYNPETGNVSSYTSNRVESEKYKKYLDSTRTYFSNKNKTGNNINFSNWMNDWTPTKVKAVENAYRSLVFSTYYTKLSNGAGGASGILKPPTIRIALTNEGMITTNELYSYPKRKYS